MSVDPHTANEIRQLVEAALARHGIPGSVAVDEKSVVLDGNGSTVSVVIDHLLARWDQLPFAERQRQCGGLARNLSRQRRVAPIRASLRPRHSHGLFGCCALALGAGLLYWKSSPDVHPAAQASPLPSVSDATQAEQERSERAARVCNATRTRVARGATVGPADVEGWVVELALVRAATASPWSSLPAFVVNPDPHAAARVVWAGAPELSGLNAPGTRVAIVARRLPEVSPQFDELVLTFHGEYVLPYFRERERIKLIRFGHALGESESATLGALYARCRVGATHHMGSWFLGSSPGAALTSLLYFMGAYAEPPQLPGELLSDHADAALVPAFALATLLDRTQGLERQEVASLIGSHDGMVAGPPHFTTLSFPFEDSDRALRASHKVAGAVTR